MEPTKVLIAQGIELRIQSELLHELIRPVRGNMVQTVDFKESRVQGSWDVARHQILISSTIIHTHPVIVLFPNHKDRDNPAMRIVRSDSYFKRNSFNRELNRRLRDSLDHTDEAADIRVAVCYGEHVFLCHGLTGTVYVLWASHVHSMSNGIPVPRVDQPFIFNYDGNGTAKGVFMLPPEVKNDTQLLRMPLTATSPAFRYEMADPPFVCEVRAQGRPPRSLQTMSYRRVIAAMTDMTRKQTMAARAYHVDMTTDNEDDHDVRHQGVVDEADALGIEEMVAHYEANPEQTPPIQMSGDEIDDGIDPFLEEGALKTE